MRFRCGFSWIIGGVVVTAALFPPEAIAQADRLAALKQSAVDEVENRSRFTQQMVDQIFSYGELGFQEFETSAYLVRLLRENGFTVEEGVAGIPTAWVATWGSGKPGRKLNNLRRRARQS